MYVSGLSSASFSSPTRTSAIWPENFAPRAGVPPRELVDDHPADVVPVPRVLAARVPQADDESKELLLGGCFVAGGFRLGVGRSFLAGLALGTASPSSPSSPSASRGELLLGGLGLDYLASAR